MDNIDYDSLSEDKEVVKLLKEKMEIDRKIKERDEFVLILLEFQIIANEDSHCSLYGRYCNGGLCSATPYPKECRYRTINKK